MADLLTVILAAGKGTRMKSNLIKVLHPVGGKTMIRQVVDSVKGLDSQVVVIVGYQAQEVEAELAEAGVDFVLQEEQLGTGHAVLQAQDFIQKHQGQVLILCGDTPLLRRETLADLLAYQRQEEAGAAVLTAFLTDPSGYGRIVRDTAGGIVKIVEEKDASAAEKDIQEINSGVYVFSSEFLAEALLNLNNDNAQGEYYLTDVIAYLRQKGVKVVPYPVADEQEILGVNDRAGLAIAERVIRSRINNYHLANGVTIIDPLTTYIDSEVEIGRDTVIYPFTYIEGKTKIGEKVVVGPHCRLVNSRLADGVNLIANCIVLESKIGAEANIGPFAYIRPGSKIAAGAKIGDFVELKKAIIGPGTKVPHLSYVGDAELGAGTNVGAGTIFANYDGQQKNKTIVGDSVFIGSNTTLVAPVKIGDRGRTGAGAVVTKDVPENETVIGVPARIMPKKKGGTKDN